jgi:hypothetical protein
VGEGWLGIRGSGSVGCWCWGVGAGGQRRSVALLVVSVADWVFGVGSSYAGTHPLPLGLCTHSAWF